VSYVLCLPNLLKTHILRFSKYNFVAVQKLKCPVHIISLTVTTLVTLHGSWNLQMWFPQPCRFSLGLRSKYPFQTFIKHSGIQPLFFQGHGPFDRVPQKDIKKNCINLEVHAKYCQRNPFKYITLKIVCEMNSSLVRKLASYKIRMCNMTVTKL
jgi:hypothetical protein